METQIHKIHHIELTKLIPHPKNANVMPPKLLRKLRQNIQRTGRYEPLVVRPHPTQPDHFELINGHHRKRILEDLGHTAAACVVWQLSDAETLLLLATVNRLSGTDAAEKRADLLESLALELDLSGQALSLFLPEDAAALEALLSKELTALQPPPALAEMPEAFTLFLPSADKKRLTTALHATHPDPATALLQWLSERELTTAERRD